MEGAIQISVMSGDPQKPKNVEVAGAGCASIVAADKFVFCLSMQGVFLQKKNSFI